MCPALARSPHFNTYSSSFHTEAESRVVRQYSRVTNFAGYGYLTFSTLDNENQYSTNLKKFVGVLPAEYGVPFFSDETLLPRMDEAALELTKRWNSLELCERWPETWRQPIASFSFRGRNGKTEQTRFELIMSSYFWDKMNKTNPNAVMTVADVKVCHDS